MNDTVLIVLQIIYPNGMMAMVNLRSDTRIMGDITGCKNELDTVTSIMRDKLARADFDL